MPSHTITERKKRRMANSVVATRVRAGKKRAAVLIRAQKKR